MFKFLILIVGIFTNLSYSWALSPEAAQLQQEWADVKYGVPVERQEQHFSSLAKTAEQVAKRRPNDPEALIWFGIIESSYAGAKGGLGALSLVKSAKKSFERAIELDPNALEGSALTSLGSLYYQVPGWPIGFGDDRKALEYLKRGLVVNPDGIDANFFYGDFLFRGGDHMGAEQWLRKALKAAPRPGRASADLGRKAEIEQLLVKISDKKR